MDESITFFIGILLYDSVEYMFCFVKGEINRIPNLPKPPDGGRQAVRCFWEIVGTLASDYTLHRVVQVRDAYTRGHRRVAQDKRRSGEAVEEANSGAEKNRGDVNADFVE